ncbi:hypothetical protein NC652_009090 [Populus alba x Populus x berolinensis]|nr:hypothetical protein NC652_009086 [Populus alba x Populus x berolinensis]KAJ6943525.1 hypothetical protein NC652_009090 [Populus alba x Populus x berolinensis]
MCFYQVLVVLSLFGTAETGCALSSTFELLLIIGMEKKKRKGFCCIWSRLEIHEVVIESHINLLHGESSLYHLAESITYKRVLDSIVMEALRFP